MSTAYRQKIVVGIIYDREQNRVLLARRPAQAHQGGMLEFPGGKALPGETPIQTLARELNEEIGIRIIRARRLRSCNYDYADRQINLSGWIVDRWEGIPHGKEGQEVEWAEVVQLKQLDFPAANEQLIRSLELPPVYFITPDRKDYGSDFIEKLKMLVRNGLKMLQFRSPTSGGQHHQKIISELLPVCEQYNCMLIYNGSIDDAMEFGAHGVHLNSSRLMALERIESPFEFRVGASCHNRKELLQAQKLELDYCILSPVHASTSHPSPGLLGWDNFSALVQDTEIPVYALGGLRPDELEEARDYGAYGIAMISGIWEASDPLAAIRPVVSEW